MKPLKLPRINYGKLSHEQLRTLVQRILTAWSSHETKPPTITLLLNKLNALLIVLDKILLREQASQLTVEVNEKDELRDRAYRRLLNKIKLALDSFDDVELSAAEDLLPVVEEFGVAITTLSQAEESSRLELALQAFNKPANLAALTVLGAVEDLDRVALFNEEFERVLEERTKMESGKEDLPHMRSVRNELDSSLRLMTKVAEFLMEEKENLVGQDIFDIMNTELTDAGSLIKLRETNAAAE